MAQKGRPPDRRMMFAVINSIRGMMVTDALALKLEAIAKAIPLLEREEDFEVLRKIDFALREHEELVKKWREKIAKASAKWPPMTP